MHKFFKSASWGFYSVGNAIDLELAQTWAAHCCRDIGLNLYPGNGYFLNEAQLDRGFKEVYEDSERKVQKIIKENLRVGVLLEQGKLGIYSVRFEKVTEEETLTNSTVRGETVLIRLLGHASETDDFDEEGAYKHSTFTMVNGEQESVEAEYNLEGELLAAKASVNPLRTGTRHYSRMFVSGDGGLFLPYQDERSGECISGHVDGTTITFAKEGNVVEARFGRKDTSAYKIPLRHKNIMDMLEEKIREFGRR